MWRAVIVCACVAAITGACLVFSGNALRAGLSLACIGLGGLAWHRAGRWHGVQLVFDAGGGLELRERQGVARMVDVDHGIHLGPLLVIVVRRRDGRRDDVIIWRDQLTADAWRRLKVRVDRRQHSRQNTDRPG
jgi:hypothetical protein